MTVATASQALLCADFGVRRILIANQLVGRANIASVARSMREADGLEVYCLADSVAGVEHLAAGLESAGAVRPVRVLVEWGRDDWRTWVRTIGAARDVLRAILARPRLLAFAGVEGFEGVTLEPEEAAAFMDELVELGRALGATAAEPFLLSAGGTAYLDLVRNALARSDGRFRGVLRSGCYATHDHGFYAAKVSEARQRSGSDDPVPAFRPALELWSCVQSLPQPNLAILTFGKRDCSHDMGPARPLRALSASGQPRSLEHAAITALNDQHAFLTGPETASLEVGDLVACGISHPCTAIDKWGVLPVVDDQYTVVDLYRTFF
jgi:D-serine dehydratase